MFLLFTESQNNPDMYICTLVHNPNYVFGDMVLDKHIMSRSELPLQCVNRVNLYYTDSFAWVGWFQNAINRPVFVYRVL